MTGSPNGVAYRRRNDGGLGWKVYHWDDWVGYVEPSNSRSDHWFAWPRGNYSDAVYYGGTRRDAAHSMIRGEGLAK